MPLSKVLSNSLSLTTLAASGAATLSNTLAVTGATTLSNTLAVTSAVTLSNTLAVTGVTTLSNLAVTGAATLSNLAVTGAATLSNTLAVTGVTTLSNLAVTGVTTLQAGTVSLPAITTTGDTNTGIYFPAADTIGFVEGGVEAMRIDSSGNVLVTSAAGLGYGTGAGGTVTQATSKATGVTLNKPTGQITMNAASLSAAAEVSFTLTNSVIAATDVVVVSIASGATAGAYSVDCDATAAGSCRISVGNRSTGSLSETPVLNFVVIRGSTS